MLYRGGRVHNPDRPGATAVLTAGDRVVWVGDDPALVADHADTVIDLDGALVTPGFVDAHIHATGAGLALSGLDLASTPTLSHALDVIAAAARDSPAATLLGTGWDETTWPERRAPTSADIEAAAPGRLVYLARVDGHTAVISGRLATASGAAAW